MKLSNTGDSAFSDKLQEGVPFRWRNIELFVLRFDRFYMSALIALGDCYLQQKQWTKAQHQYESALLIAQTNIYIKHERDILMKLADTCKNNPNLYRKYVEQFHQLSIKLWKGGERNMTFHINLETPKHLEAEPPDA